MVHLKIFVGLVCKLEDTTLSHYTQRILFLPKPIATQKQSLCKLRQTTNNTKLFQTTHKCQMSGQKAVNAKFLKCLSCLHKEWPSLTLKWKKNELIT